jgi:hypothetical protein
MATTLMPLDPATSPQRVSRILTISAHLLPGEIIAARRARRTRGWVLVVLLVVVILLAGWYALTLAHKSDADDELASYATQVVTVQRSLNQNPDYAKVNVAKAETETLTKQLTTVMSGDLPWATLFDRLNNTAAAAGVGITGITGSLAATTNGTTGSTAATLPSTSGSATIGTLTITGTGPDKPSIAQFADKLGTLSTVANPYLTSVATGDDGLQYSLTLDITAAANCGRFATACKTGGN